ncbi:MAG: hypothetical protein RMJ44_02315 [Cytophagales bacterium]|nr:hypothetical protein [Bernardetiaceae bacterium]MDW8209895.1 hypothetical protein [Cytophagales bacterium]
MKVLVYFLCFQLLLSSCRLISPAKTYQELVGTWKEEWGASDVTYRDVYQIAYLPNKQLIITCKDRPNYLVRKVHYNGNILQLEIEIRDEKYNTGSANLYYQLRFVKDLQILTGTAINHENKVIPVKWLKQ